MDKKFLVVIAPVRFMDENVITVDVNLDIQKALQYHERLFPCLTCLYFDKDDIHENANPCSRKVNEGNVIDELNAFIKERLQSSPTDFDDLILIAVPKDQEDLIEELFYLCEEINDEVADISSMFLTDPDDRVEYSVKENQEALV